tara:strand:- start:8061 stop:8549 length:489 start_codon:yes stop_codon:yes gene_type:complete
VTLILQTLHGSRLYGTAHADSDYDTFVVDTDVERAEQTIDGADDLTQMSLEAFLENVFRGSAQSCEAMFSPVAQVDPRYAAMFAGIRVTGAESHARYRRNIEEHSGGNLKRRRHAVRLGLNFAELRATGRFDPQMNAGQRSLIVELADRYAGRELFDVASNL